MSQRQGLLIIISSPSGAGKSTLVRALINQDEKISFSVSATTRPTRPKERDGVDYHFLSHADFHKMVAENKMLEHAKVFGEFYGTPRAPVEIILRKGHDIIFDIDWQGGQQIKNSDLKAHVVSIFILPPSIAELNARLKNRAQDNAQTIANRMASAQSEISHWAEYDYVLTNKSIETTLAKIQKIIVAERLHRTRQIGLGDFVQKLNNEIKIFHEHL